MYETTFKISQETGLGNYDGGWFPKMGVGAKIDSVRLRPISGSSGFCRTRRCSSNWACAYPFAKWLAHRQAFFLWSLRTELNGGA